MAIFAIVAAPILVQQWLKARGGGAEPSDFVRIFGPVYLVVLAVLWGSALPEYFGAVDGVTSDGTPIGNLAYAAVCFVVAAAVRLRHGHYERL